MKALVNKIIPFSAVDGPGNRTAIFLQGCNFDCKYCHNPETIHICNHCGICVEHCPGKALALSNGKILFSPGKCMECDACIRNCPNGSSPRAVEMTAGEILEAVKEGMPFIRGITLSGGECTLQAEFLKELLPEVREYGLSVLLDSNGSYNFSYDQELLALIDGVMLDIKACSQQEHRGITGRDNKIVLDNLMFLAREGKLEEVRTVVVPELFCAEDTIRHTAEILAPFLEKKAIRYKLIAYRPMGVRSQYRSLRSPEPEEMERLKKMIAAYGFPDVVII